MLKKRKFFWWGILLLLLLAAGWGYYQYQRPHQSAAGETANVTIGADSLYGQYARDEKSCDAKYLGKVVEVSGRLSEVQQSGQSEVWILSTGAAGTGGVNCQLFPGEKVPEPHPKPGDQVTVKGRCTGFLMDVNLSDCTVIKK
ncbi:hypothetical protein Q4E93_08890 [Flavitalea sp. BT771]|uniref:OB-fold protein n=1 Tax=Flavitalea sp. BT771 TaxID=3063329 RepID=UPI0026E2AC77|nr:hypothetical protein [Flavitalea sp. BT771]MDO6430702.1 hypothetical protein [Flavitalea sp. BT771]MDV6219158.1 hypothetical protein [Flavitalea sp. BT771]